MGTNLIEPRLVGTDGPAAADGPPPEAAGEEQRRAAEEALCKQYPIAMSILQEARAGYEWLSVIGRPDNPGVILLPFAHVRRKTFPVEDRDSKWGEFDYTYPVTLCAVAVSNPLPGTANVSVAFGPHGPAARKRLRQGEVLWCQFHDESGKTEEAYRPKPHEIFVPDMRDVVVSVVGDDGIAYEGAVGPEVVETVRLTLRPRKEH
jgi:hypothetical protein